MTSPHMRNRPGDGTGAASEPTPEMDSERRGAAISSLPRRTATGCPCGCHYDEDCIRHRAHPIVDDWQVVTVEELGLPPHNQASCPYCVREGAA